VLRNAQRFIHQPLAASVKDRRADRYDSDKIKIGKDLAFCQDSANLMEFILFFSSPPQKRRIPTHIAHIGKAIRANAETKALPKSAIPSP